MYLSSHELDRNPRPLAGSLCNENPRALETTEPASVSAHLETAEPVEMKRADESEPRSVIVSLETAMALSTEHGAAERLLSSWFGTC
jgi:hypothetical protein